jgi:hypothetical protein
MEQCFSFLIRSGLISEIIILKLSYVNKFLNQCYKKYLKNIPEIEVWKTDIETIINHNRIITFYKYKDPISQYLKGHINICENKYKNLFSNKNIKCFVNKNSDHILFLIFFEM